MVKSCCIKTCGNLLKYYELFPNKHHVFEGNPLRAGTSQFIPIGHLQLPQPSPNFFPSFSRPFLLAKVILVFWLRYKRTGKQL